MMIFRSRTAAALAAAAALSLVATPAMARGWHRHRDGIDGGDVLAGVLILGGIAAIASAASKSSKDRQARADNRYRDYPDGDYREVPPQRYGDDGYQGRSGSGWRSGTSVDGAVDACVAEMERDGNVDSIDSVSREGDGWRVHGRTSGGSGFTCSVDGQGRVQDVSGL